MHHLMDFDDGTLRGIVDERRTEEQLRFAFRSKFTQRAVSCRYCAGGKVALRRTESR